jgi:hypothetical protein
VPVWQRASQKYVDEGSLVVLGVIQEQHAERCRLYAQWKNFKFPIVQDQLTSNGLAVVPVVIFIDEHGIVRNTRPRVTQLKDFAQEPFPAPAVAAPRIEDERSDLTRLADNVNGKSTAAADCTIADGLMRWQQPEGIDGAITAYRSALSKVEAETNNREVSKGQLYFRLGVAFRARFDAANGREKINADDFSKASNNWSKALDEDPNQYIWRRRIQQYGPRLEKPYPFYDWIENAQHEIRDRGDKPVDLKVALTGSELAQPAKSFATSSRSPNNPDPDAKITEDNEGLVQFRGTVVPHSIRAGKTARVHLLFVPCNGKWNNEGEPMKVWIERSDQFQLVDSLIDFPNESSATSSEPRMIEFEIQSSNDADGQVRIEGFALYGTCTTEHGQCLYRRLPFRVPIQIVK